MKINKKSFWEILLLIAIILCFPIYLWLAGDNLGRFSLLLVGISIAGFLFLIFRNVILWYWRINDVADSLEDIAESLKKISNIKKEKEDKTK